MKNFARGAGLRVLMTVLIGVMAWGMFVLLGALRSRDLQIETQQQTIRSLERSDENRAATLFLKHLENGR